MMMTKSRLLAKIKLANRIALFAHQNPDPDAYGAMFALQRFCKNLGKDASVFAVKNKKGYLDHLFPLNELKTNFVSDEYDLVILLDVHMISRLDATFQKEVKKSKNLVIVDHHKIMDDSEVETKNVIIYDNYAATCEILTDFAVENGLEITPEIATYLYTGLMGDTDRFLHVNLTKHVFETAMILYNKKAEVQRVYDFMYRYKTPEQLKLNKFLLDNMVFLNRGKAVYTIFGLKDLEKLGADQEDVKVYSNEMVKIKGVQLSFLCIEYKRAYYKFSIRSNNGINTVNFSKKMGGGGHVCASGFEKKISRRSLQKQLPKWTREILNAK